MERKSTTQRSSGITRRVAAVLVAAATVTGGVAVEIAATPAPTAHAANVDANDWRGVVNAYRAMSGLGPVGENGTWSAQGREHSAYMLINGITHVQEQGKPGYTPSGYQAGINGNVAVTSSTTWTARQFVELWLTGPFHAIGVLRHNLVTSGYGQRVDANAARWKSGATLDVLRGIDGSRPRPTTPIVFPGRDATTSLYRFIAEYPNPVELVGWTGDAGLPLIAMMPRRVTSASATLTGPNGPVEVRVLHEGNTNDATAKAVMAGDHAVVVVPRVHLADGRYTATVRSNGGDVTWSFTVDRNAPLVASAAPTAGAGQPQAVPSPAAVTTRPLGDPVGFQPVEPHRYADSRDQLRLVRLRANRPQQLRVGDASIAAISANFTVDRASNEGFLSVYNTRSTPPLVSTLNFTPHAPVANQAVIPTSNGNISLMSNVDVDVIVDINGRFRSDAANRFVPIAPTRIVDSNQAGPSLRPDRPIVVKIADVAGIPATATAVAVNVTVDGSTGHGFVRAYPTGTRAPWISNLNLTPGATRANSAIVPIGSNGTITLDGTVGGRIIVDVAGYFAPGEGLRFTPLEPVRMLDTRVTGALNRFTGGAPLRAGQTISVPIAGVQGVPADAKAVSINLTATQTVADGYVSVYPGTRRPPVSTLNVRPGIPAVANGAMVVLDGGRLTIYTHSTTHVLIDINGVWR